jgi:para-aminobenzoate synthetase component 1
MLLRSPTRQAEVLCRPVDLRSAPAALLGYLEETQEPALLDSAAFHERYGRFSILACCPLEVLTLRDGLLRDRRGDVLAAGDEAIWRALADALGAVRLARGSRAPYTPGWIGYVGYEVGRHIERLPGAAARDTCLPDLRLAFHDALLLYDARDRQAWLVELSFASPPEGAGRAAEVLRAAVDRARHLPHQPAPQPAEHASGAARPAAEDARPNFSPGAYRRAVRRCLDYIAAGDIFQVNLSQRFEIRPSPEPLRVYHVLRQRNPAWYAAYLSFRSEGRRCAVLSSSPELFLRVRGRQVLTRPIKGTRPRIGSAEADAAARAELLASEKDNAELAMIVDLLRNDLGRVCEFGSVRVAEPRTLETHPTVFHLVATVEGMLRREVGPADLLRATFPGGSITGAPKIRAMEIIDELEPLARGVYTGCIGIVGVDGTCEWNIAIRTVLCEDDRALLQVGGGIVADSDPDGEYRETLDKARAMLEAIAEARRAEPLPRGVAP